MVFRKKISIVLCLCMLVLASMPVLAANCSHNWNTQKSYPTSVKSVDSSKHETTQVIDEYCSWCTATRTVTVVEKANHSIVFDDLGHTGTRTHYFLRRCTVCNYSEQVSTICDYNEWGFHAKP